MSVSLIDFRGKTNFIQYNIHPVFQNILRISVFLLQKAVCISGFEGRHRSRIFKHKPCHDSTDFRVFWRECERHGVSGFWFWEFEVDEGYPNTLSALRMMFTPQKYKYKCFSTHNSADLCIIYEKILNKCIYKCIYHLLSSHPYLRLYDPLFPNHPGLP